MADFSARINYGEEGDLSAEGKEREDAKKKVILDLRDLISTLATEKGWTTEHLYQYQGFWFRDERLLGVILNQQSCFEVGPNNILLVTSPKTGTTWLKALGFAVLNRTRYSFDSHPLLSNNPHDCVPFFGQYDEDNYTCLYQQFPPICQTHIPYTSLPETVLASGCKIIYMYRDPKDVLVSFWKFGNKLRPKELPPLSLEDAFELFSKGVSTYGPYWDHVLGYWKASLGWPNRMLFLTYEQLQNDPILHVKKIAEFIGHPFSLEEEREGIVSKIINLCRFENLSNLEVNKTGTLSVVSPRVLANNTFFRKGEVGDWKSHLTAEMADCLDRITEDKFKGTALFKNYQV